MRNRVGVATAALFACAFALQGQVNMFRIELVPSGAMVSMDEPVLKDGMYVFTSWPERLPTKLKSMRVRKITRLTGAVRRPCTRWSSFPREPCSPRTIRF